MKPRSSLFFILLVALALVLLSLSNLGSVPPVHAEGTFISAPNRVDMVHDPIRNLLYITSGSQVLRYDLNAQQFLSPFDLAAV